MPERADARLEELTVIDRLVKKHGKYALVVGVAKRSRELKERIESALVPSQGRLIRRAISEVAEGRVKIRPPAEIEE
jgi:DNA-directed RNA polymerase subunit K/omega